MNNRKAMKLATRGKRFGAFCIDAVIPVVIFIIFTVSIIALIASSFMHMNDFGYGYGFPDPDYGLGYGYGYGNGNPSSGTTTAMIISLLLGIGYIVAQLIFFSKSSTIGKYALGLQVVSSKDGEPVGFWLMLFREWFVKQASGAIFLLGYIWILIDERNRGWHDKILDTYVVDLKETEAMNIRNGSYRSGEPAYAQTYKTPETAASEPVYQAPETGASETVYHNPEYTVPDVTKPFSRISAAEVDPDPGSISDVPGNNKIKLADAVAVPSEEAVNAVQYDTVYAETKELLTGEDAFGEIPEEADSETNEQK